MDHPFGSDARRWVPKRYVTGRELPEERTTAAENDGYEVDRHFVEETELETLSRDRPRSHSHHPIAGDVLRAFHRRLDAFDHKIERRTRMRRDPLSRSYVRDDDDWDIHGMATTPSVGEVEQCAPTHQRIEAGHPLLQVVEACLAEMERDIPVERPQLEVAVVQPVEQVPDRVVFLSDVAVQRHRSRGHDFPHRALPSSSRPGCRTYPHEYPPRANTTHRVRGPAFASTVV